MVMPPQKLPVILLTGMSGAGKSQTLKVLEDLGYETIDNLPLSLLVQAVEEERAVKRPLAIDMDARTRDFSVKSLLAAVGVLRDISTSDIKLIFVDCDDDVLTRRFTETRRRHPLGGERPVLDGIRLERHLLEPIRAQSDVVLDTSLLTVHDFKVMAQQYFAIPSTRELTIFVNSFSYRYGLPREADIIFDARLLDNPFYQESLRPMSGKDTPVQVYIQKDPSFAPFLQSVIDMIQVALPKFKKEGRTYLTIAFGCTGGKHRSVFMAETLSRWFKDHNMAVTLSHRDVHRKIGT